MRFAALALIALVLAACGSTDAPTSSGASGSQLADLTVKVDTDGAKGASPAKQLKLTCAAAADSPACGAAAGVTEEDLAPVPNTMMCTQIYGGPQIAEIKGTLHGKPVDATYSRTDGCQISRWQHVQTLLEQVR